MQITAELRALITALNEQINQDSSTPSDLLVAELFEEWFSFKKLSWAASTAKNRRETLLPGIQSFFAQTKAKAVSEKDAIAFINWLKETGNSERTINDKLVLLKEWWEWSKSRSFVKCNPWHSIKKLKVPVKRVKPFTSQEIKRIVEGFELDASYSQLTPFVKFMLGSGLRTGEAISLQWQNFSDDCSAVTVVASKTNAIRSFYLPHSLVLMLRSLKPINAQPSGLVFTWNGKRIDLHNFRTRTWKPILERQKVPYRRPYNCRHTFASHSLDKGMNPVSIAEITGHNPRILFEKYAGVLHAPQAPDILTVT